MEALALVLFAAILVLILAGYPVAFTLAGLSVIVGYFALGPEFFNFLPSRIMGVMSNYVLMAVPLFIFMGIMLEKSGLAAELLETTALVFGRFHGGLAIAVVIVGTLLAASTGIVGATVITMGLISLPTMLKRGYAKSLSAGTIASSGTLGQIIPPSIVLVLLGSVLNVSVGELFKAAFLPGIGLVLCYALYIAIVSKLKPELAPAVDKEERKEFWEQEKVTQKIMRAILLPIVLIIAVLGSIFTGIASPTEAAAVGALGASLLTAFQGKLNWSVIKSVSEETTKLSSMVFFILIGATTFSLVFRGLGGDRFLIQLIETSELSFTAFFVLVMILVFVAGFFIDFIEIIFIIVPVVSPIFVAYDVNLIWLGIVIALNLQTSFLTPPFGFSLFYLKGVAPPELKTGDIYRGVFPFIVIQLIFLLLISIFPGLLGL